MAQLCKFIIDHLPSPDVSITLASPVAPYKI